MAYNTIDFLKDVMPKTVTIGTNNSLAPTQSNPATFSTKTAGKYLNLASQYIDSRLSSIYVTPIARIKKHEETGTVAMAQNQSTLTVTDNGPYNVGDMVRVSDDNNTYVFRVKEIPESTANINQIVVEPASPYNFAADSTISILEYPAPIPEICIHIAAAMLFDREFNAQNEPDISNYGKSLMAKATSSLDKVLSGAIRLYGQEHTGRRFVKTALRDTWNTTAEVQPGSDKE